MHYNNAPIAEAIIDVQFAPQANLSLLDYYVALRAVQSEYPQRQELPLNSQTFMSTGSQEPVFGTIVQLGGVRFLSSDGQRIVTYNVNGFSFSLRSPYSNWADFRDEARRVWEIYARVRTEARIIRAAVRYVNRIVIPDERFVLGDYFHIYPQDIQQLKHHDLAGFALQVVLPQPDISAHAVINSALTTEPPPPQIFAALTEGTPVKSVVFLDIDVFRANLDWVVGDAAPLWNFMEQLHERKNEIFEACITDRTRELIR